MFECRPLFACVSGVQGTPPRHAPTASTQPVSLILLAPTRLPHLPQTQAPKAAADPDQDARDAVATGLHLFVCRCCACCVWAGPASALTPRTLPLLLVTETLPQLALAELTKWAGEEAQRRETAKKQAMHYATGARFWHGK